MPEFNSNIENTWCPGCGNFGILNAVKQAFKKLHEAGVRREKVFITAGIGCHGKIFDYLKVSGFYSLHGRAMTTAQGVKLANPELSVVAFVGDGDAMGEGLEHMIFAARRNADITVIMHDNGVYGLTTGQAAPTSEKGFRGPSTPQGSVEEPLNPLSLMIEAGATFVARGYPLRMDHLVNLIVEAVMHEGFSFLDVLQPCVSYNDTYQKYSTAEIFEFTPQSVPAAMKLAKDTSRTGLGVFYRVKKPAYHTLLYGIWNPVVQRFSTDKRREAIDKLITPMI